MDLGEMLVTPTTRLICVLLPIGVVMLAVTALRVLVT
jgi:hypothetical protein